MIRSRMFYYCVDDLDTAWSRLASAWKRHLFNGTFLSSVPEAQSYTVHDGWNSHTDTGDKRTGILTDR